MGSVIIFSCFVTQVYGASNNGCIAGGMVGQFTSAKFTSTLICDARVWVYAGIDMITVAA